MISVTAPEKLWRDILEAIEKYNHVSTSVGRARLSVHVGHLKPHIDKALDVPAPQPVPEKPEGKPYLQGWRKQDIAEYIGDLFIDHPPLNEELEVEYDGTKLLIEFTRGVTYRVTVSIPRRK